MFLLEDAAFAVAVLLGVAIICLMVYAFTFGVGQSVQMTITTRHDAEQRKQSVKRWQAAINQRLSDIFG